MTAKQSHEKNQKKGLLLPGLDGANPLGFLAALGVIQSLGHKESEPRILMKWVPYGGTYVPEILDSDGSGSTLDESVVLRRLQDVLIDDITKHAFQLLEILGTHDSIPRRQIFCTKIDQSDANHRTSLDWLAALASDFTSPQSHNQLQTPRKDYYYSNLKSVVERTKTDHLRRSLFLPWDYADALDNQSLHLDPTEDRCHAHQWNKPSGDPNRKKNGGMLGANRLAIEAIPLFTSFPEDDALHTVGFTGNRSTNTRWTWPIWDELLDLTSMKSLLSFAELQEQTISWELRCQLRERGIAAAFRSSRILVQKTPNFTPARRIA